MERWFNVGKIVNTHGIRGEVRVISRTDFPEKRYAKGNLLYLFLKGKNEPLELIVNSHRQHKNFDLLTFEGYTSINDVEPWKDGVLKVSEQQLETLSEGEYYYHEIIGCHVFTDNDLKIGVIKEILSPGANDVWVVQSDDGKQYLIPYIDDIVLKVAKDEKYVVIKPIEGLLD